jgi:predicted transposase YdaD
MMNLSEALVEDTRKETIKAMILRMKDKNLSLEEIADLVGVDGDFVKDVKREMEENNIIENE